MSSELVKNNRNLKLAKCIRCTTIFIYSVADCNKAEDGHRLIIIIIVLCVRLQQLKTSFSGGNLAKIVLTGGSFEQIHAFHASNVSAIMDSISSSERCSCCRRRMSDVTTESKSSAQIQAFICFFL
jgi:hypothetical protein